MTSTQVLLTLDKRENEIVEEYANRYNLSKMNAIKEIIRKLKEDGGKQ